MIYKLFGTALVLGASVVSASTLVGEERHKIVELETYIELLRYIRNQIDLYSAPLGKIFLGCQDSILRKLSITERVNSFGEILEKSALKVGEDSKKTLCEFANSLGKNYRDVQIKLCDKTIGELEGQKKSLEAAFASRRKTIIALCFGLGGMTIIALF